jgi:hypothetical protein
MPEFQTATWGFGADDDRIVQAVLDDLVLARRA